MKGLAEALIGCFLFVLKIKDYSLLFKGQNYDINVCFSLYRQLLFLEIGI